MASQFPPQTPDYDEDTLDILRKVFSDVCIILKAHDPLREWEKDDEVRTSVALSFVNLVDAGVIDPVVLRKEALDRLPPWSRPKLSS